MSKLALASFLALSFVGCRCPEPAPGQDGEPYDLDTILVRFRAGVDAAHRARALAPIKPGAITPIGLVKNVYEVEIGVSVDDAIASLQRNADVEDVEPNYKVIFDDPPNDPGFAQQWGHHNARTPQVDIDSLSGWEVTTGDPNFVVAVIDTGVMVTHEDLQANIWVNPAEQKNRFDDDGNGLIDDIFGWNYVDNNGDVSDPEDHGTRVAGILGMRGNNGLGGAGVLWECQIMVLRIDDVAGAIKALAYAVGRGVRVSNNSWSCPPEAPVIDLDILKANYRALLPLDHIFVTSAGNDDLDIDSHPVYPNSFDFENIIAVTALTKVDTKPYGSNYGATHVDLGAPGDKIYTTSHLGNYATTEPRTSYAAPFVTGVVAAVMINNPAWGWSDVRRKVLTSTRPVAALAHITATGGCVNLGDALH